MKRYICIFNRLIFGMLIACISLNMYAQHSFYVPSKIANGPAHPLIEKLEYIRSESDSVVYKEFDGEGKETNGGRSFTRKDVNGLVDTIYTYYGLIYKDIYTYDAEHKLVMMQSCYEPINGMNHFKYDQKGRLLTTIFFEVSNPMDTIEVRSYIYLDDQTIHTDSGYFYSLAYEIREGAKIRARDTSVTEYVFDAEDRLIRAGNKRYYYLPDGRLKEVTFTKERFHKTEVISDKENGSWEMMSYYALGGDKWKMFKREEGKSYKNGIPLSIDPLVTNMQSIAYGARGGVILTTETGQPLRIYTFNGQLVKQVNAVPDQLIPLPRGVYIVVVGSRSCKVVVK